MHGMGRVMMYAWYGEGKLQSTYNKLTLFSLASIGK